jgi:hypothetical protein
MKRKLRKGGDMGNSFYLNIALSVMSLWMIFYVIFIVLLACEYIKKTIKKSSNCVDLVLMIFMIIYMPFLGGLIAIIWPFAVLAIISFIIQYTYTECEPA